MACGEESKPEPEPQDGPRYTEARVRSVVNDWARKQGGINPLCREAEYVGDGFWQCGGYQFDEQTGLVAPLRR